MAEKMSNAEYRQKEGLSSTDLKTMVKSMKHWKYYKDNPEEKDSPTLLFGRAYHKWVLEPYDFYEEFAVAPICDRRTKEGKQIWNDFVASSEGKDVISNEDFETIQKMRDELYATPFARKLLMGNHEESFFWKDERTGIDCKCRPDSWGTFGNINVCTDLKTCESAEASEFMRSSIRYNYDIQAYFYTEGLKANLNKDFVFVFVCQEKKPPYACNILQADEDFMASGKELTDLMLDQYKECLETDNWYGYMGKEPEIGYLSTPNWMKKSLNIEMEGDTE